MEEIAFVVRLHCKGHFHICSGNAC